MPKLLHQFNNGDFRISLYDDGTKVRKGSSTGKVDYPESIDCKVTNWCDASCFFCHEKSTRHGKHADLDVTLNVLKELPPGTEIAIGGGHPLAHPNFEYFVESLSDRGIICNVTINEKHLEQEIPRLEKMIMKNHIYGVGYSYSAKPCEWKYSNLVSHVIIGLTPPSRLLSITRTNPKVLLLGYKTYGRGINYKHKHEKSVNENIDLWYRWLFKAARQAHLSFDNLAVEQLNVQRLFHTGDYDKFYMGSDGNFTMYLDGVEQNYAKSSISSRYKYLSEIKDMFAYVRNRYE